MKNSSYIRLVFWLFFIFVFANTLMYLTTPLWFPVHGDHYTTPEVAPLAVIAIIVALPFILLEVPIFIGLGILLKHVAFATPEIVRIPLALISTAAISAMLYGLVLPKIGQFCRDLWFRTLPEDMREVEKAMLNRETSMFDGNSQSTPKE